MNLFKLSEKFSQKTVDLPLSQDASARFVPWIVGVMIYLALLLGFFSALFFQEINGKAEREMPQLTLEFPAPAGERAVFLQEVTKILKASQRVERFRVVPVQDVRQAFIEFFDEPIPEFTDRAADPLLVDLWARGGPAAVAAAAASLGEALRVLCPQLQVLVHQSWTRPLFGWVQLVQWGTLAGAFLFLLGLLTVVAFAVRTGVSIHAPVLDVLELMGASELYIIRQFQRQNWKNILKSLGIAGILLALSFLGGRLFSETFAGGALFLSEGILNFYLIAFLCLTGCILLILGVTRWVVKNALKSTFVS